MLQPAMDDFLPCYDQVDLDLKGCPPVPPSPGSHRPSEESEARLELLAESLQRLGYQVLRQEDLQLEQQQHIVRLEGELQCLQEQQQQQPLASRLQVLERGQSGLAAGAQRAMQLAMKAAEAHQSMSERQDELNGRTSHQVSQCQERIEALEARLQEQQEQLGKLPTHDLRSRVDLQEASVKRLELRLKQLEAEDAESRLEKLQKQLEALDLRVHSTEEDLQRRPEFKELTQSHQEARKAQEQLHSLVTKHDQRMEAMDVALAELQAAQADALFEGCKDTAEGMRLDRLEEQIAKMSKNEPEVLRDLQADLGELRGRLNDVASLLDEPRLRELRTFSLSWPELNAKLDRLGTFTAESCAKTESLEVRLDLTRANVETQEQRLSALSSRLEKRPDLSTGEEKFGKPQKQLHFDIKALAVKQLELKKEELAKASKLESEKLEKISETPKETAEKVSEKSRKLEVAEELLEATQEEQREELSGDEPQLPGFGFSTSVRRSMSGFTGC